MNWLRRLLGGKTKKDVDATTPPVQASVPKAASPAKPAPKPEPPRAKFPYPVEIVHGSQALAAFDRLKKADRGSPIIVGSETDLQYWADAIVYGGSMGASVEKTLSLARTAKFPGDLVAERKRLLDDFRKRHPDTEDEHADVDIGDWPDIPPEAPKLTVAYEVISQKPFERVCIALIPTRDPTEIPAYLHAGDWNECPSAFHQVAALRSWRDRYGAEVVGMSHDVMNLRVARRPEDPEEAMKLAREQFDFCEDIVLQGTNTLSALAASLMDARWWYFWWD